MAIAFATLNRHILFGRPHMLKEQLSAPVRRHIFRRSTTGLIPYVLATALAAVSPYITLAITAVLAAFYALPIASGVMSEG